MARKTTTAEKLDDLKKAMAGRSTMLIGLQDNPDPDALGAAAALRKLANATAGVQCSLACGGTLGRAENRAMARYLDLNLRPIGELDPSRFDLIALVDTQPGQGNNSLPRGVRPHVVIDHHPIRPHSRSAPFTDVRSRYGATSTILFEYLEAAGIVPEAPLATALLYGIRSDTQDLGRESTRADIKAYEALYPLANKRMLGAIQRGQVPSEYFEVLATALAAARRCGSCIYSALGAVRTGDLIAEVADLMLRHEAAQWSLCWGYVDDKLLLSVRTSAPDGRADSVAKRIVSRKGSGGGHHSMAGGQIPLTDSTAKSRKRLDALVRRRYVKATGNDIAACRKLF
jgi:nanoRNase/pAp phosphatase (c-di-AMP/oligoRNAs hydrolase)